jgi:DNA polymerase-1
VGADYSAIEMAVAAALSGDKHMLELIANGTDIHAVVAAAVFGAAFTNAEPNSKPWKEMRNVAKRAGFGRLYGAGAATVARQCGVSVAVARKALAMFDRLFPGVKAYADWVATDAELVTFTGRRIRADETRPYANINYYVQSSARDVFMLGGLRAAGAGLEPYFWLPIHDEWIVQAPEKDAKEVGHVLESALASSLRGVQFKAEAEVIGTHWVKK